MPDAEQAIKKTSPPAWKAFTAGLFTGLCSCYLFNPWDRALYLSVKDKRAFLSRQNWLHPYQGVSQAMVHRTLRDGMYFPLLDLLRTPYASLLRPKGEVGHLVVYTLAGNTAGAANGVLLNGLTAVKYQCWGQEGSSFMSIAWRMYRKGGLAPFFHGVYPTVARDAIFGGIFAGTKFAMGKALVDQPQSSLLSLSISMFSGSVACIVSSPWNYARNMQYSTKPGHPAPTTMQSVTSLFRNALQKPAPLHYLQSRLRIGWGTARVATGMAVGFEMYSRALDVL